MEFKVGDKVSAFGVEGEVISLDEKNNYPITVEFDDDHLSFFMIDGRASAWHLEPSLKLIEKAKKKVKKKFWFYIGESDIKNLYIAPEILYLYKPKEQKNCQVAEIELEVEE
jgi:hypothetical protein